MKEAAYNGLSDSMQDALEEFYEISSDGDIETILSSPIRTEFESIDKRFTHKEFHAMGGMKKVCRVIDEKTSRPVAYAELRDSKECSEDDVAHFIREAKITAALEHPSIVPIYDLGVNDFGKPYFTMKFLKDQSLSKILKELSKQNPLYKEKYPLNILLDIFIKICDAIAFAHSCRIVHLDLKPENIMIGNYGEVYVCDWGLAKLLGSPDEEQTGTVSLDATILNIITLSGVVKGTPGFMAPEQIDSDFGTKDERTDIYALGAILYSLITFKQPFCNLPTKTILFNTLHQQPPSPAEMSYMAIPEGLSAICQKAMAKQPENRYESVDELIREIRSYQQGFATEAERATTLKSILLLLKRHKIVGTILFFFILTVTSLSLFSVHLLDQSKQENANNIVQLETEHSDQIEALNRESLKKEKVLNSQIKMRDQKISQLKHQLKLIRNTGRTPAVSLNLTTNEDKAYAIIYPDEIAGVVERGFWENACQDYGRGTTDVNNLRDSYGLRTGMSYTFVSDGTVNKGFKSARNFNTKSAKANDKLMGTRSEIQGNGTITFSRVNAFASVYDVIVYSARPQPNQRAQFSIGNTHYFTGSGGTQTGPLKQSKHRTDEECLANRGTHYVRFNNLTDDTLVIKSRIPKGGMLTPINGIQIIRRK